MCFRLASQVGLLLLLIATVQGTLEPATCNGDGTCTIGESMGGCAVDCGDSASTIVANGMYVGYFATWKDRNEDEGLPVATTGAELDLAQVASYVTHIQISFAKPDLRYVRNSFDLRGTGMEFDDAVLKDGTIVRDAISIARAKGQRVIIAIGGATYHNWDFVNIGDIVDLVADLGADGIDLDWETGSLCNTQSGVPVCDSDDDFTWIINAMRTAFPRPYLISSVGFSVGAYGWGDYMDEEPADSSFTGVMYNPLKRAGDKLDFISIMAYDASAAFDPIRAFDAYRLVCPTCMYALGVMVPPESWGDGVLTLNTLKERTDYVAANGGAGMMIWNLQRYTDEYPDVDAQTVSTQICEAVTYTEVTPTCSEAAVPLD
eukprot:TRINITY_DN17470_c0_g1_i1.p1 TRINITY_DN17470_c0_g1~~TRINITY_DN17470_c0_g1_i1.p1  ORF type:complete len:375 (+),score=40.15 TRINITY_DN17470_c0_g1_i1:196-1320(+)